MHRFLLALPLVLFATAETALGQASDPPTIPAPGAPPPSFEVPLDFDSGRHDGVGGPGGDEGEGAGFALAAYAVLSEPGAPWMRLRFGERGLGGRSFVRLRSLADGAQQDLHASTLENWYGWSAFFNGDALEVELHVAPEDRGVFVTVDAVLAGNDVGSPRAPDRDGDDEGGPDSICGSDDRVASNDLRVGRVRRTDGAVFCSPWLASNGAVLLAGHCLDNDNNGTNELITAGSVVELSPPASAANGTPTMSAPEDQYPIDMSRLAWPTGGYLLGSDWGVIGLNENALNGDEAHATRGFFRMTRESPSTGATIRITGCGDDSTPAGAFGGQNAQNQTLQTDSGPYVGQTQSANRFWHEYSVDTTNNSSGSPVIWGAAGVTIGIHTNGGCSSSSGNFGVSFEHDPLEQALRDFVAPNATFVDAGMPALAVEDGTVFRPYDRLEEGLAAAPAGGVLGVVAGTYDVAGRASLVVTQDVLLVAPSGPVVLK